MSAVNNYHLNFDTFARLTAIRDALAAAELRRGALVLDVGGHPGLLAGMLDGPRVITADFPSAGPAFYARASGTALPFASGRFQAVVCSDVLEHVAPAERAAFLQELWRAASRWVVIGGPFFSHGLQLAETRLCELRAAAGMMENPWLAEHRKHGLPRLDESVRRLESLGASCAAVPSGSILRWFLLFGGAALAEMLPGVGRAWDEFMPLINKHFPGKADAHACRHLIVACKDKAGLDAPHMRAFLDANSDAAAAADPPIGPQINALASLLTAAAAALRQTGSMLENGGGGIAGDYLSQMEKAMAAQSARIEALRASAADQPRKTQSAAATAGRIARKLKKWIRRGKPRGKRNV